MQLNLVNWRRLGIHQIGWIGLLLALVWISPNSQELIDGLRKGHFTLRFRHERWAWISLGADSHFLTCCN